jgi:hypothetical protein
MFLGCVARAKRCPLESHQDFGDADTGMSRFARHLLGETLEATDGRSGAYRPPQLSSRETEAVRGQHPYGIQGVLTNSLGARLMPTYFVFIYHSHHSTDVEGNHPKRSSQHRAREIYKDASAFCAIME